VDASSSVLAVACASPDDEHAVLAGESGSQALVLRVADSTVGELRYRPRGEEPPAALVRMIGTTIALEVERARAPEKASVAAVESFLADLLSRSVTDRENIVARGKELGADLSAGASILLIRVRPHQPQEGDWRTRALRVAARGALTAAPDALAARVELGSGLARRAGGEDATDRGEGSCELAVVIPGDDPDSPRNTLKAILRELELDLANYGLAAGRSRPASDPADLHRAGAEALLAANVAETRDLPALAFEETGAYRLLLPAMSEDPAELQSFHDDTVAPLVAYDEQYETELLRTLETFLDADGNIAQTAQKLYTHRHTIRYRLDRVRELTGLDVGSTDGRERLGLGLKAMRVLGIPPLSGPAREPGAEAGRVPRGEKDR
jgi:sugar diacid utilization regulator